MWFDKIATSGKVLDPPDLDLDQKTVFCKVSAWMSWAYPGEMLCGDGSSFRHDVVSMCRFFVWPRFPFALRLSGSPPVVESVGIRMVAASLLLGNHGFLCHH